VDDFGFLRSQRVRPGGRFAGWEARSVRVMTGDAILPRDRAGLPPPIAGGASVGARLPIAIGWTVTTAAQPGALGELQLATIAGLEHFEIGLIVAIEAEVVPVMAAVPHDNIRVFLGDNDVVIFVVSQSRRFALFVADVTIKVGQVGFGRDELAVRNARRRVTGERGIDERNGRQRGSVPPEICDKGHRQRQESHR